MPSVKIRGGGPELAAPVHTTGSHLSAQESNATKGNDDWSFFKNGLIPAEPTGRSEWHHMPIVSDTKWHSEDDREQTMVVPSGPSQFFGTHPAFSWWILEMAETWE